MKKNVPTGKWAIFSRAGKRLSSFDFNTEAEAKKLRSLLGILSEKVLSGAVIRQIARRYPYTCLDCPAGRPFRCRASYARHRRVRHPAPDVDPTIYDPEPLALDLELGGVGHGHGALPTLDVYDEITR